MTLPEPENIRGRLHCPLRGQHMTNGKICDDNKGQGWKEYASCRRHLRNHDEENPPLYTCGLPDKNGDICQFMSNHSATMFAHRNGGKHVHPDKFQFQCEICLSRFPLRQALERHSQKHKKSATTRRGKKGKTKKMSPWMQDGKTSRGDRLSRHLKRPSGTEDLGSLEMMLNFPKSPLKQELPPGLSRFQPGSTKVDGPAMAALSLANFEQLQKALVPHQLSALPLTTFSTAFPDVDFSSSSRHSADENEPPADTLNSAAPTTGLSPSWACHEISGVLAPLLDSMPIPPVPPPQPQPQPQAPGQGTFTHQPSQAPLDSSFDVEYLNNMDYPMDNSFLLSPLKCLQTTPQRSDAGSYLMDITVSPESFAFPLERTDEK